ncbi:MAG TPA: VIT1/CCC1 family protein [Dehalococcoidales bacterium]|nr:VIT1/CCC1 family protein [Dehalococcoidales bacterium]
MSTVPPDVQSKILAMQRGEITEYFIYQRLAKSVKDSHNRDVLKRIARDELGHHNLWQQHTGEKASPSRFKIWFYYLISRVFGLTFGIKLMEEGEEKAQVAYNEIAHFVPEASKIASDEHRHEQALVRLIDEERLHYAADVVRGLNVAIVELTGTLAGLTLALPESNLIVLAGLITGAAMVLSVASTEYLGAKSGGGSRSPLKAVLYGGLTNVVTFIFLLFPYLIFDNVYLSLGVMIFNAIVVVFLFSLYISIAREISFRRRFSEMALASLGVAALAFLIGYLARTFLHLNVE